MAISATLPKFIGQYEKENKKDAALGNDILKYCTVRNNGWNNKSINAIAPMRLWFKYTRLRPLKCLSKNFSRALKIKLIANKTIPTSPATWPRLVKIATVLENRKESGNMVSHINTGIIARITTIIHPVCAL